MQLGSWLMLLGCALYLGLMVLIVCASPERLDKWLELLAAVVFVGGCIILVLACYPSAMTATLERLSRPPSPSQTLLERYVTGSEMLLSTQLFNLGMLPYLAEGALNTAFPPPDDPPGAGLGLLLGTALVLPLLALFRSESFWLPLHHSALLCITLSPSGSLWVLSAPSASLCLVSDHEPYGIHLPFSASF